MSSRRWREITGLLIVLAVVSSTVARAGDTKNAAAKGDTVGEAVKYLRVRRDADRNPVALETAITRYRSRKGVDPVIVVDLIGAVHVGEKSYYDQLNKVFKSYDAVLYELVAPEGARVVPRQRRKTNPVSFLQNVMKDTLNLEFQLDHIQYSAPNLVHADMSPDEFSKSMEERGESFFKMFLRAMASGAAQKNAPSDLELLVALVATDRAYRLKCLLAEQFESMEEQLAALNGPNGSTIITQRNKKALQVLREQISGGKKRLAIFYGAGHLSEMADRLEKEFGLQRERQRWLVAWTITRPMRSKEESQTHKKRSQEPAVSSPK